MAVILSVVRVAMDSCVAIRRSIHYAMLYSFFGNKDAENEVMLLTVKYTGHWTQ